MSGFLERLRIEKSEREARLAREEAERKARAERMRSASDEHWQQQQLSKVTLRNSVAPQLARELYDLIEHGPDTDISGESDGPRIQIQTGTEVVTRFGRAQRDKYYGGFRMAGIGIEIQGRPDGSIVIGDTVIGPNDTRNAELVEGALQKAYVSPKRISFLSDREPSPE